MTVLAAAEEVRRFGLTPQVALLSHSSFGTADDAFGAQDARRARPDRASARPTSRSRARCTATRR